VARSGDGVRVHATGPEAERHAPERVQRSHVEQQHPVRKGSWTTGGPMPAADRAALPVAPRRPTLGGRGAAGRKQEDDECECDERRREAHEESGG